MVISFVQSQFLVATCCTGAGPGQWNVQTHFGRFRDHTLFWRLLVALC